MTEKNARVEPYFKGDVPYAIHWGIADVKGKRVMDIGADVGSTADFFLRRGAKEVIAVEGDKFLYEQLVENSKILYGMIPIYKLIVSNKDFQDLFTMYKPQVVKIDIEGGELHLVSLQNNFLGSVPEYMIECHSTYLFSNLMEKFLKIGYSMNVIMPSPIVFHTMRKQK